MKLQRLNPHVLLSRLPTDLRQFPIPDPHVNQHFEFNGYVHKWVKGLPPHYEPVLYVQVDDQPHLVGRYIESCKVRLRKFSFLLARAWECINAHLELPVTHQRTLYNHLHIAAVHGFLEWAKASMG